MKKQIGLLLGFITVLTIVVILCIKSNINSKIDDCTISNKDRGVMSWLKDFSERDFVSCDDMLEDKSTGLMSYDVFMYVKDRNYYDLTLNKLVDCISSIKVKNVDKNKKDTEKYTITVEYTKYRKISELVYSLEALKKVKKDYIKDSINDTQFTKELNKLYYKIFSDSCFQSSNGKKYKKDFVLTEKKINGVVHVLGTVDFVDFLLNDCNITDNINLYEEEVKDRVSSIIKAG